MFNHLLMGVNLKVVLYCILKIEAHVTMIQVSFMRMDYLHELLANLMWYCKIIIIIIIIISWLIRILEIYKIDPLIINSLQQLMKKWNTTLQVKGKNNQITSDPIHLQ